jgi:predicted metallopeptidase
MADKVYSRVTEAEEMIKLLCEKQPEVLWCVQPSMVAVLGIENKERSEKNKTLAKIKAVKGCEKAILQLNNVPVRYIIEVWWSDWHTWTPRQKQWLLVHELLHIHHEIGKSIKHDCEDFKIILDKVGVNWIDSQTLPDLLNEEVKFNLELRPSLEESDEIDDLDEEEESKSRKKAKKEKEESKKTKTDTPETPKDEDPPSEDKDPDEVF